MADHPTGRYPDFLVIGAQKAGTTWLYENLRLHERLWLPLSKEVHYFDGLWPNSFLLDLLARSCQANTNNPDVDFAELRWLKRFAFDLAHTQQR